MGRDARRDVLAGPECAMANTAANEETGRQADRQTADRHGHTHIRTHAHKNRQKDMQAAKSELQMLFTLARGTANSQVHPLPGTTRDTPLQGVGGDIWVMAGGEFRVRGFRVRPLNPLSDPLFVPGFHHAHVLPVAQALSRT